MSRQTKNNIPKHLKNPPRVSIRPAEVQQLDQFFQDLDGSTDDNGIVHLEMSKRQLSLTKSIISTFLWISDLLSVGRAGVGIIRKVLGIFPKSTNSTGDQSNDKDRESDDGQNNTNVQDNTSTKDKLNGDSSKGTEVPKSIDTNRANGTRPHHNGRRGSDDLVDAAICDHYAADLKEGDPCPGSGCNGRVYKFWRDGKPREVVTFDFSPMFRPTIHRMHDLRCNTCLRVHKTPFSDDLIKNGALEGRYLYPAISALGLLHYGLGMPMYRLDQFQQIVGERFPESTQFDILEKLANSLKCLTDAMIRNAANGYLLQGDDIQNRVLELVPELRERRSDGQLTYRDGVHTSILIATTTDGHLIPVLSTGIIHFGEHLDSILKKRSKQIPAPLLVCDGNKVNQSFVATPITGGCWQHALDYFIKAEKSFPTEAQVVIDLIKKVFEIDRQTHQMAAEERLLHLKEKALPMVEEIKQTIDNYDADKVALPKSELGAAIQYVQNQYSRLLIPFTHEAVPIHNNVSEWCTYLVVRMLANSRFYKSSAGAAIGDTIMMAILFCYLSQVNPYDYMIYCLQHQDRMKKSPEDFFPWKLKGKVKDIPSNKLMRFWTPPPPVGQDLVI